MRVQSPQATIPYVSCQREHDRIITTFHGLRRYGDKVTETLVCSSEARPKGDGLTFAGAGLTYEYHLRSESGSSGLEAKKSHRFLAAGPFV